MGLLDFFSNKIEFTYENIDGEKVYYCSEFPKYYFKFITKNKDFLEWEKLIKEGYKNQKEGVKLSLNNDRNDFIANKFILLGVYLKENNELFLTQGIKKVTIEEIWEKSINIYGLKKELWGELKSYFEKIEKRYKKIFEITRFSKKEGVKINNLFRIITGILRSEVSNQCKNDFSTSTLISITSKSHASMYRKIFRNSISNDLKHLELLGEDELELTYQLYPNFYSDENTDKYIEAFENAEKANNKKFNIQTYIDSRHICYLDNGLILRKEHNTIFLETNREFQQKQVLLEIILQDFKTFNKEEIFNQTIIEQTLKFLHNGCQFLNFKNNRLKNDKKYFLELIDVIFEYIKIEFGNIEIISFFDKEIVESLRNKIPINIEDNRFENNRILTLINLRDINIKLIKEEKKLKVS